MIWNLPPYKNIQQLSIIKKDKSGFFITIPWLKYFGKKLCGDLRCSRHTIKPKNIFELEEFTSVHLGIYGNRQFDQGCLNFSLQLYSLLIFVPLFRTKTMKFLCLSPIKQTRLSVCETDKDSGTSYLLSLHLW